MELKQGGLEKFWLAWGKERIFGPSSKSERPKNLYNISERNDCQLRSDLGLLLKCQFVRSTYSDTIENDKNMCKTVGSHTAFELSGPNNLYRLPPIRVETEENFIF